MTGRGYLWVLSLQIFVIDYGTMTGRGYLCNKFLLQQIFKIHEQRICSHRNFLQFIYPPIFQNLCFFQKEFQPDHPIGTSSRVSDLEQVAIILIIHLSLSLLLSLFQLFTFLPEG